MCRSGCGNEDGSYLGEVYLHDEKTKKHSRTVPITYRVCRELLPLLRGKELDDPVFAMSYPELDFPWAEVREATGLKHVRFKDLRVQVSQYGEEAGIPQTLLTKTYGHSDEAMTRRHQRHGAPLTAEQAEALSGPCTETPKSAKLPKSETLLHSLLRRTPFRTDALSA